MDMKRPNVAAEESMYCDSVPRYPLGPAPPLNNVGHQLPVQRLSFGATLNTVVAHLIMAKLPKMNPIVNPTVVPIIAPIFTVNSTIDGWFRSPWWAAGVGKFGRGRRSAWW